MIGSASLLRDRAVPAELAPLATPDFLSVQSVPLFDADECRRIVDAVDPAAWAPALVTDRYDAGSVRPDVRSVLGQPLGVDGGGWPVVELVAAVEELNRRVYRFELTGFTGQDRPSLLRYEAGTMDQFRNHRDVGAFQPTRKLSCIVQLTEPSEYRGGDLLFHDDGRLSDRSQGTLTVFPSFLNHQVTPVLHGIRHVIVAWVHGPTFR